jgi:hypothetical protein
MIRFAWLQSRTRTLLAAGLLAALAIAAAVTGLELASLYDSLVGDCRSGCDLATSEFLSHDLFLQNALNPLVQVVPALLGMFWGAPLLARELESGTYRLAWTQGVPRSRWLLAKLGLNGLATAGLAGLLSLTVTWWYRVIDRVGADQYAVLDRRDLAPIGYAAFAFALGALCGAVLRRTLPAMAVTLAVFVLARITVTLWVRPHLLPPMHRISSLLSADQLGFLKSGSAPVTMVARGAAPPGSWTLSSSFVTGSGHIAGSAELSEFVRRYCPAIAEPPPGAPGKGVAGRDVAAQFESCRAHAAQSFRLLVSYQPANRYWTFQWLETGIFVALGLLAAAGCYWWVTRRGA